jgi:hypothetical protein
MQCTALELRCELAYLEVYGYVDLRRHEGSPWTATLTRAGIDVVDYTVEAEAGIGRPTRVYPGAIKSLMHRPDHVNR